MGLWAVGFTAPRSESTPLEILSSPFGINLGNPVIRLFLQAQQGDSGARLQIQRRFLLMDSLGVRWVRFDVDFATLFPNLAIDRETGDTMVLTCDKPVDLKRFQPVFRFSLLRHALVRAWRHRFRPVLVLAYAPRWASTDPCRRNRSQGNPIPRCSGQFLPNGKDWLWVLSTLKDSLDQLLRASQEFPSRLPLYLQVWNEPNIYLYVATLYDCSRSDSLPQGVRCDSSSPLLSRKRPKDPRKRICYVSRIYERYVDTLLVPALRVFGNDPRYRVLTAGPGVDPVWEFTQPSWFTAFRVLATRLEEARFEIPSLPLPKGISIHWYHHQGRYQEDSGISQMFLRLLAATRETLSVYAPDLGLDTLPIWVTEFGTYTLQFDKSKRPVVDLHRQTQTLAHLYEIFMDPSLRVSLSLGPAFLYRLADFPQTGTSVSLSSSFGVATLASLQVPLSVPWDHGVKPTAYIYRNLAHAWASQNALPYVEPDGIRPDLWPPLVPFQGRFFLAYRGYRWVPKSPKGRFFRVPQIYVAELTPEGQILDLRSLTKDQNDSVLTLPTLHRVRGSLYLAYGAADTLHFWTWKERWVHSGALYLGVIIQSPFLWYPDRAGGVAIATRDRQTVFFSVRRVGGVWKVTSMKSLPYGDPQLLSVGKEDYWIWDREGGGLVYFGPKGRQAVPGPKPWIPRPLSVVALSASPLQVQGLLIAQDTMSFFQWSRTQADGLWHPGEQIPISDSYPRTPSPVWKIVGSQVIRGSGLWLTVVDSFPLDGGPLERWQPDTLRSQVVLYQFDGRVITSRTLLSSSLFVQWPFLVLADEHTGLFGFLEGAYEHYILRVQPLKI